MPEKVGKRKAEYGFSRFLTKRVGQRFGMPARFAGRSRRRRGEAPPGPSGGRAALRAPIQPPAQAQPRKAELP